MGRVGCGHSSAWRGHLPHSTQLLILCPVCSEELAVAFDGCGSSLLKQQPTVRFERQQRRGHGMSLCVGPKAPAHEVMAGVPERTALSKWEGRRVRWGGG